MNGIQYINTGDWVESCTAITEDHDGTLRLVDWSAVMRERAATRAPALKQITSAKPNEQKTAA